MNYKDRIQRQIKAKKSEGKYSLFDAKSLERYLNPKIIELTYNVIKESDDRCNLSFELGKFLDEMTQDSENIVAFSRVYIAKLEEPESEVKSNEIVQIASTGLANNGHVNSSAAVQKVNPPSNVLSPFVGLEGWVNLVNSYKKNNAVILYSIPSKYMNEECDFIKDDYDKYLYNYDKNNIPHLKPEYLMGIIIKNKGASDIFLTRDEMLSLAETKAI